MKKFICITAAAAVLMSCTASCGSHAVSNSGVKASAETYSNKSTEEIVEEVTGKWETSYALLDGEEVESIYKRYIFEADGTGVYYDADGNEQSVRWSVNPLGGMILMYEELGEITETYSFIGCDMVCFNDTAKGKRETHIVKIGTFTKKDDIKEKIE